MATFGDKTQFFGGQLFGSTHIPKDANLSGQTVIVTGANTGIGFECAKHLARLKVATLILACRSVQKGNAAKDRIPINKDSKTVIEVWELDLSSYQSVLAFTERVRTTLPRLDAFISNAGVRLIHFTQTEGMETTLTVNVISNMLLNIGVLPKLRETSVKHSTTTTLTIVGSMMHIFGPPDSLAPPPQGSEIDTFDVLNDSKNADMTARYPLSKTLLHAVAVHLAAGANTPGNQEQVVVNWVNPGWCATELERNKNPPPLIERIMFAIMGRTAEQGSQTLVHGIVAGKRSHSRYLSECRPKPESVFLRSKTGIASGARLWKELLARIEKISPETAGFVE